MAAAKAWRADAQHGVNRGTRRAPTALKLSEAAAAWLDGAKTGAIRTRSGDPYKPSVIRSYEAALTQRILPNLGSVKLAAITRNSVQDIADRMLADGLDPSTIRNTLMPMRALFRRAVARGEVMVNPMTGLELAAVRGSRDRIASPAEAVELLAALPDRDRGLWAVAMYSGLRRGELQALRWESVDLTGGRLHVVGSWDEVAGPIAPKSAAGERWVPIPAVLREHLAAHKLLCRWSSTADGFVFGARPSQPFSSASVRRRAKAAWSDENARRRGEDKPTLAPITLHEARHTFASLMIAAGVNAKALATYMGHASVTITYDRYGHLMPGNEHEAASLLDAYIERATETTAG